MYATDLQNTIDLYEKSIIKRPMTESEKAAFIFAFERGTHYGD
jgi:hypothetical protein